MLKFSSHRGFSILMALGVTAVLMIVVTGLAAMYARELKLSRLSYDEVLVQATAEGMFEYGMLKIKNHEAGFADEVKSSLPDLDTDMFKLSSARSEWLEMDYKIDSQINSYIGKIPENGFLTIPLFVAECDLLDSTNPEKKSCKPDKNVNTINTKDIEVTGLNADSSWTISAMNVSDGVALQGVGNINATTEGYIELRAFNCSYVNASDAIDSFDSDVSCDLANNAWYNSTNADKKEELMYSYQIPKITVQKFLDEVTYPELGENTIDPVAGSESKQKTKIERKFPYLTIYNNSNIPIDVNVESTENFSLPTYAIISTAKKGDASQVFTLSQDKGSSLDILKFGYYGQ